MADADEGAKGAALGIDDRGEYETACMTVAAASAIYLYADGVSEAANSSSELFSEERLEAILRYTPCSDSCNLVNAAASAAREFAGEAEQSGRYYDDGGQKVLN